MADSNPIPRPPGSRVLVVDDERVVRRALQRVLERDGHQVALAGGWREIDGVLLDVRMPDGDGREVLRRMRPVAHRRRHLAPALACTPDQVPKVVAAAMAGRK
jgi:CheY-like chemotaxis protein